MGTKRMSQAFDKTHMFYFIFYFMCVGVLPTCIYVCFPICIQSLWRSAEGITCELPCTCWELNPGPLEEQPVPFIAKTSFQALHHL